MMIRNKREYCEFFEVERCPKETLRPNYGLIIILMYIVYNLIALYGVMHQKTELEFLTVVNFLAASFLGLLMLVIGIFDKDSRYILSPFVVKNGCTWAIHHIKYFYKEKRSFENDYKRVRNRTLSCDKHIWFESESNLVLILTKTDKNLKPLYYADPDSYHMLKVIACAYIFGGINQSRIPVCLMPMSERNSGL